MGDDFWRFLDEAEGFLELGSAEGAAECLDRLPPEDRTAVEALRLRCRIFEVAGSHENMVAVAEILVGGRPDVPAHWESLMRATRLVGRIKDALQKGREAVALHPGHVGLWLELAQCQIKVNDLLGARKSLERAIDADPSVRSTILNSETLSPVFFI